MVFGRRRDDKVSLFWGDRRKLFQLDSFVNRCRWIGASPQFWDDTNPMSQNSKIYSLMNLLTRCMAQVSHNDLVTAIICATKKGALRF